MTREEEIKGAVDALNLQDDHAVEHVREYFVAWLSDPVTFDELVDMQRFLGHTDISASPDRHAGHSVICLSWRRVSSPLAIVLEGGS